MKLTITHLKAPWPVGAKVGDVLDLPAVPPWAAGKCIPAGDDAAVTVGVMLTEDGADAITGDGSGEPLPEVVANVEPEEREAAGWGKRKGRK